MEDHIPRISVFAVSHLGTRSLILRGLIQLLEVSLVDFVQLTLEFTLPFFVFHENTSTIEEIAQLLKKDVPTLLVEEGGPILSYLMIRSTGNFKDSIQYFMQITSLHSGEISFCQLFRACQLALIAKLSLELGNNDPNLREQVFSITFPNDNLYFQGVSGSCLG